MRWATVSSPRRGAAGFTLAEVAVALLLLMLLVGLTGKAVRTKDVVIEGLEEWVEAGAVWYLAPDADPLGRALGLPAALSATPPAGPPPLTPPVGGGNGNGNGNGRGGGRPGNGGVPPGNGSGNGNAGGNGNGNAGGNGNGNAGGNGNGNGGGTGGGSGRFFVVLTALDRDVYGMTATVRMTQVAAP